MNIYMTIDMNCQIAVQKDVKYFTLPPTMSDYCLSHGVARFGNFNFFIFS